MRWMFSRAGAMFAMGAVLLLAACTVVVQEPPRPNPPPPTAFCPRDYNPVCARNQGDRQTFANACLAEAAGYRVIRPGECRRDGGGDDGSFCTREYAPVCARHRGDVRTFPNACEAEAADYRIIADGPC